MVEPIGYPKHFLNYHDLSISIVLLSKLTGVCVWRVYPVIRLII